VSLAARRWLWLLAGLVAGCLPLLLTWLATPPEGTRLSRAHFGQTVDDDAARGVTLPHRWADDAATGCTGCRTVWYRFDRLLATLPSETQAVLLTRVAHNAAIYLNGRLLAQGGRFADPSARLGARPLWAEAEPGAWNLGENRLYVLVKATPPQAGRMTAPALGDAAALAPALHWRNAIGITLPQVAATAAAMLALTMGGLWAHRKHELPYATLAFAAAAFAMQAFAGLVVEPPLPDAAWDGVLAASALLTAGCVARLAGRLQARSRPRRTLWAASVLLLAATGGMLAVQAPFGGGPAVAQGAAMGLLAGAGLALAAAGWRAADPRRLLPGLMLVLAALHDGLWPALDSAGAEALPAMPLAVFVLLGTGAWSLLLHFVQTLNAVELLKIDLEALVAERTQALQAQFQRVRELERQQTIATERERLMRDMHDGVGGHLVAMLAIIEADRRRPGELATAVRDALDDMRLMVDSLEPVDDDLNAVLAMLHDRLAPRMKAAGVTLHWDVDLLPPVAGLTPTRVLHVLRMLQEAVTNAIRHGQARTLCLSAHPDAQQVRLTLRDDGGGFDPAATTSGRGLKNLRRRSAEVGASLDIVSAPGQGCTVHIGLPRLSTRPDDARH